MNAAARRDTRSKAPETAETGAAPGTGMLERAFAVIRALSEAQPDGGRVTRLAKAVGLTQGTVHRILHALIAEGIVEQDENSKLYRLSVNFSRSRHKQETRAACARYAAPRC